VPERFIQGIGGDGLSEEHGIGLEHAPALASGREGGACGDDLQELFVPVPAAAAETPEHEHVAVKLYDGAAARLLVEVVHVLRDDRLDEAHVFQLSQGDVAPVGSGVPQGQGPGGVHFDEAFPYHLRLGHEPRIEEERGIVPLPDAARRTEVRHP
jgi:hypothetical protein